MTIPNWASQLVSQVLEDYKRTDAPILIWRRKHKSKYSSGTTYCKENKIIMRAGGKRKEQKLVLLHELAHWLMPAKEHHGKAFWDLAFELYRKYNVPMYYSLNREGEYRKEAVFAYRRNRKLTTKWLHSGG